MDAGPDLYLCADSAPCQLLDPTISGAAGPYTYLWIPGTGLNDSTILNPCARPDTTTIYALVVTAGNGCTSDYNTTDTLSTVTVHVAPLPVATAPADIDICYGDTVMLSGLATGAGPSYDFEWSPSVNMSDSTVSNPLVWPTLTTDYTLVVWSNGCPSYADTVTVNVHTLPTVDAGPDREICLNETALLDATASGDPTATGYTFEWSPTTGVIGSSSLEDITVSPPSTTMYYVTAESNWGCGSAADSALVSVRPTPIAEAGDAQTVVPMSCLRV